MRKILFVLFAIMVTMNLSAQQESGHPNNVIKTNPLGLAFGNFNFTYERVLNSSSSILASANYQYRLFGVDVNSFGAGVAWRYYFTHSKKDVPSGFYINPQVEADFGNVDEFNYTTIGFGAEVGYQWSWASGFTLDLGVGPQYTILAGEYEDIGFDREGGILPAATLAIGYAW